MECILVIEDNTNVRENLAELLELSGYDVLTAEDGKSGIKAAMQGLPDLILCDIMMPEMDGYSVLRILRDKTPLADVPFLFLTAKAEKDDFRKGMGLGADDYITKPFDDVELLDTIELRLRKRKQNVATSPEATGLLFDPVKAVARLTDFADDFELRSFSPNEVLFRERNRSHWVFLIESGYVKEVIANPRGKEFIVRAGARGEIFGLSPLFQASPYQSTLIALDEVVCYLLPTREFLEFSAEPEIRRLLLTRLVGESIASQERMMLMAYGSVREKVAAALLALHALYVSNGHAELRWSREDIANMAGVAKETAIRTLSDFRDEGRLEIHNHAIVIPDAGKLRV